MTAPDPGKRQQEAADVAASVWVAASAGTGKTKVLTDRVLALMLAGAPPTRADCMNCKSCVSHKRRRLPSRNDAVRRLTTGEQIAVVEWHISCMPEP